MRSMSPTPSRESVLKSIRLLVGGLRTASRDAEKKFGISGAQLYVLQKLSAESGLSMNELAERTLTHQSSVSVVVTRLEEKKLVERKKSAQDARRLEIRLTGKGKSILARAPNPVQNRLLKAIESLSESDRKKLASLLSALNTHAGFVGAAPLFFEEARKGESS